MSYVRRHTMLCKTCCNTERSELPKMLLSGLNRDVQGNRNELGAEIPPKQVLDALGFLWEFLLQACSNLNKTKNPKTNSDNFLNQRLQVVLKY